MYVSLESGAAPRRTSLQVGGLLRDAGVFALYSLVVLVLFHHHLLGQLTFPWDFQGGYHAKAVARLRDGTFLAPPLWMPWGGFGIPSQLSLQDGAWYLPLYAYAALFGYDLVDATRLQVFHVLFGACGMYAASRVLRIPRGAAMIAGFAYLLGGTFYSNAQHVDIVRGAALLPWLFLAFWALWERQTAFRFVAFVFVLWQYMVGGYPGQVVATAYFLAVALLLLLVDAQRRGQAWKGKTVLITAAVSCAVGLILPKFLPAFLDPESVRQAASPDALVDSSVLTTLLFDFDLPSISNDLSMRDLFFPACLLPFALRGVERRTIALVALGGAALAAAFIADNVWLQGVIGSLPLTRTSRFPLSDFRPILHFCLALLAALGIARAVNDASGHRPWGSLGLAVLAAALLTWLGLDFGQSRAAVWWAWGSLVLGGVLMFGLGQRSAYSARIGQVSVALLALGLVAQGVQHQMQGARTWRVERSLAQEYATYGSSLEKLTSENRFDSLAYRPERIVYEALPVASPTDLYSAKYQYAWYAEGFSAFGYENVGASPRIRDLYSLALHSATPDERALLDWLLRRSTVYLLAGPEEFLEERLPACRDAVCRTPGGGAARVEMEEFREEGAVYLVSSDEPFWMAENEVYYPGWVSLICSTSCRAGPAGRPGSGLVRMWSLPAGEYRFVTYFQPPGWKLSLKLAWLAAFITIVIAIILAVRLARTASVPQPE
jgi:hypothetical protein